MATPKCGILLVGIVASLVIYCDGHGRLIEPPSRASAWRYGFQTPPDYNDHELYCGGFTRQWKRNEGKCGECGDAWDSPEPRAHEFGGPWGQGVIVRRYLPATEMTIRVELTASHMGYFEFRLCPQPNGKQDCLDKHLLRILSGSPAQPAPNDLETRFYPRNGSRIYEMKAQLPDDLKCDHCMLQWRYVAGNNWGMCPDGNGAVGCGPQEEFRSCSDIAVTENAHTPIRPFRPTTTRPTAPKESPTRRPPTTETAEQDSSTTSYTFIVVICIILALVVCAFALWYSYRRNEELMKQWLHSFGNRFCKKHKQNTAAARVPVTSMVAVSTVSVPTAKSDTDVMLHNPPVPPPRTKRTSRVRELSADGSSVA